MSGEDKRFQVFISSTFNDLIEERAEVTQAIMELNHMPYGMEAFPAANETQWEWIKRAIRESDYYIVIIGGKYGSVNPKTEISYTEMEYRYAEEVGVPTIAFLVDSSVDLPKSKIETDPIKAEKLQKFKDYIENNKLRKSYISKEDLKSKVIVSFMQLINSCPRTGWIRANSLKNYTSNDEVIQLMKENAELKAKLAEKGAYGIDINSMAKGKDKYKLQYETFDYSSNTKNDSELEVTWDELFQAIGTDFYMGTTSKKTNDIKYIIYSYIKYTKEKDISELKDECLTKVLIQFETLGYLQKDKFGFWSLSSKGKEYYLSLNIIKNR
ncbi:DUF4062 domain-containing protein [Dysgonomonas massiliensis]|uniref:DUF4062 domain-containing protein n=1 Tax=Dysgonomonas massiliensis TaxID=2040292 RepID=UPI000C77A3A9|nr:DUF4062 domain-containing protein [Dysgonomonas massiliensis]